MKGCDRAARAPAASSFSGAAVLRCATRGLPGSVVVRSALRRREVVPAQLRTRHAPPGALFPRVLMRLRNLDASTATDPASHCDGKRSESRVIVRNRRETGGAPTPTRRGRYKEDGRFVAPTARRRRGRCKRSKENARRKTAGPPRSSGSSSITTNFGILHDPEECQEWVSRGVTDSPGLVSW